MTMLGMNVDEVRAFAGQLSAKADEIDQIVNALSSQLGGVQWLGPDATRFTDDWNGQHRPQLHSVACALRDAASVANTNVAQQETASNT